MKLKITMDNGDEYWTNWIGWTGTNDKASNDIESWLSEGFRKDYYLAFDTMSSDSDEPVRVCVKCLHIYSVEQYTDGGEQDNE